VKSRATAGAVWLAKEYCYYDYRVENGGKVVQSNLTEPTLWSPFVESAARITCWVIFGKRWFASTNTKEWRMEITLAVVPLPDPKLWSHLLVPLGGRWIDLEKS